MEWIVFVLILAFAIWVFQMVVLFKRTVARFDEQITQVRSATAETEEQADRYQVDQEEKNEELAEVKKQAEELDSKEKEMRAKVADVQQSEAARRPTRHRVEGLNEEDA